jgi:hypothetical protein
MNPRYASRSGSNNYGWRGADASYSEKHYRLRRRRGRATACLWGCSASKYEWANLTGNYDDENDYAMMCTRCHRRFDYAAMQMEEGFVKMNRQTQFDESLVRAIRTRVASGEGQSDIAREFCVPRSRINKMVRRTTWAWVP